MSEISICTGGENEGEGLLDTTYDSTSASPLLSPSEKELSDSLLPSDSSSEQCYEGSPTDSSESSCDELSEEEDELSLSLSSASSTEDCEEEDSISERTLLTTSPLYEASKITVFDGYLLLFHYVTKHSLTHRAFTELLQLVSAFLPSSVQIPRSVHRLKQLFSNIFPHSQPTAHYYCEVCLASTSQGSVCTTAGCYGRHQGTFLTVSIGPQIKKMMEEKETWDLLQARFNSINHDPHIILDVYDGEGYTKHKEFLSHPANVSLLLNTDGVAVFRSSKATLWPVWIVVNELPKRKRFVRDNVLLAGLWFSKDKPPMNLFLSPVIQEINCLYREGIEVQTPDGVYQAHAMLLMCATDLIARAQVTNMKQFNGKFGCLYCLQPGQTPPDNNLIRYWSHVRAYPTRTNESILRAARTAVSSSDPVQGIKGPSVLNLHPPFQLPWGVIVDDLHCLYLGVANRLIELWFDKKYRSKDHYIGQKIHLDQCDRKLLSICVPNIFSRPPKSITDVAHWKGSELRNWLLFYSLPVLKDVLPNPYLSHYSMLVAALSLLSSDKISLSDIDAATEYLQQFYRRFHDLYGERNVPMNVHLLIHICDCVKMWGPLWCYSCFTFETMNGHLKKLFHGTRDMTKQMAFTFVAMQALPKFIKTHTSEHPDHVVSSILIEKRRSNREKISDARRPGSYLVGRGTITTVSPDVVCAANDLLSRIASAIEPLTTFKKVSVFYRVELNGSLYYSAHYRRVTHRNSYTIAHVHSGCRSFGQIQYYIAIPQLNTILVVVQKCVLTLETAQQHFDLSTPAVCTPNLLHLVTISPSVTVVEANTIERKCLFMDFGSPTKYIICVPSTMQD